MESITCSDPFNCPCPDCNAIRFDFEATTHADRFELTSPDTIPDAATFHMIADATAPRGDYL